MHCKTEFLTWSETTEAAAQRVFAQPSESSLLCSGKCWCGGRFFFWRRKRGSTAQSLSVESERKVLVFCDVSKRGFALASQLHMTLSQVSHSPFCGLSRSTKLLHLFPPSLLSLRRTIGCVECSHFVSVRSSTRAGLHFDRLGPAYAR